MTFSPHPKVVCEENEDFKTFRELSIDMFGLNLHLILSRMVLEKMHALRLALKTEYVISRRYAAVLHMQTTH